MDVEKTSVGARVGRDALLLLLILLAATSRIFYFPSEREQSAREITRESVEATYSALPQPTRFLPAKAGAEIESVVVGGDYYSNSAHLLGRYQTAIAGAQLCGLLLKHLTEQMQWTTAATTAACEPRATEGAVRYSIIGRQAAYSIGNAALSIRVEIDESVAGDIPTSVEVWIYHTLDRQAALDCARDYAASPCKRAVWKTSPRRQYMHHAALFTASRAR